MAGGGGGEVTEELKKRIRKLLRDIANSDHAEECPMGDGDEDDDGECICNCGVYEAQDILIEWGVQVVEK